MPRVPYPKSDWNCREPLDAYQLVGEMTRCWFCGTRIRWIHVLVHEDHPKARHAGKCCAQRLCHNYDATGAETDMKNRFARLQRFCNRERWKDSKRNPSNIWRIVDLPDSRRMRVTIYLDRQRYGVFCAMLDDAEDTYAHRDRYKSQAEAMNVAFELVETAESLTESEEEE